MVHIAISEVFLLGRHRYTNIYKNSNELYIYMYDYIRMFICLLKMHWRVVADCIFFPLDLLEENWQVQRIVTGSLRYPRKKSVYIFFKLICAYGIRIEGLKSQKVPQGVYSPVILHHPLLYQYKNIYIYLRSRINMLVWRKYVCFELPQIMQRIDPLWPPHNYKSLKKKTFFEIALVCA